jgi:hypothetical protein
LIKENIERKSWDVLAIVTHKFRHQAKMDALREEVADLTKKLQQSRDRSIMNTIEPGFFSSFLFNAAARGTR